MNDDAPWVIRRDDLLERVVSRGRARKRRRAFGVAGAAVALIVALAVGAYLPGRDTRSLQVANPTGQATTTTVPSATTTTVAAPPPFRAGVLLIGDAHMLGAKAALQAAIPGVRVDAALSRQFGDAVADLVADDGVRPLPQTIVIDLGDNGPSGADAAARVSEMVRHVMQTAGPGANVFFLTLKLPRTWESAVNAGIYAGAARWPKAHVLAWHDFSAAHPEWFTLDGFHLSPAGQAAYAAFVHDGIRNADSMQVPGSPLSVDLDGDGRPEQLRVTVGADGVYSPARLTATLADGRVVSGMLPYGYSEQVLGAADIAGDGRHEVLMTVGGETWMLGAIIVLDGDRLVAVTTDPDGFPLGWGQHSNSDPRGTADLACVVVDGQPSLVEASSTVPPDRAPVREWKRSVYALEGAKLVLRKRDSGTRAMTAKPQPDLPLANTVSCGTATLPDPAAG